jgi:di/tricarboxylate transporter
VLQTDDVLWFAGSAASVRAIRINPGLVPLAEKHASKLSKTQYIERRLVQAIVAEDSPLVDATLRDVNFRKQFNAAVIAIGRKGQRLRSKPGDVALRAGDILLLDTGGAFFRNFQDSKYFSIVIELENTNPPRFFHTFIAIVTIATAFALYAAEVLDILLGAAITVAVLLLTGTMTPDQARSAIRWDVYLMIAGSFGVSAAMEQSGAAAAIANGIISIGKNAGGETFIISAIYVATMLMSQIISNNSAAALVFPIAATISKNDGIDIYLLAYAIMLGASCVFMSSFG